MVYLPLCWLGCWCRGEALSIRLFMEVMIQQQVSLPIPPLLLHFLPALGTPSLPIQKGCSTGELSGLWSSLPAAQGQHCHGNGLLLEVLYSALCDSCMGGMLVLPALCPVGLGPHSLSYQCLQLVSILNISENDLLCFYFGPCGSYENVKCAYWLAYLNQCWQIKSILRRQKLIHQNASFHSCHYFSSSHFIIRNNTLEYT